MNDYLRNECKMLKVLQGVSYKELAELIEVRQDTFYSWLKGYFNFSPSRQKRLKEVIGLLKEVNW